MPKEEKKVVRFVITKSQYDLLKQKTQQAGYAFLSEFFRERMRRFLYNEGNIDD